MAFSFCLFITQNVINLLLLFFPYCVFGALSNLATRCQCCLELKANHTFLPPHVFVNPCLFKWFVPQTLGSGSVPEFFRIMSRQFTAHEWSAIHSAGSEEQQLATFYRHWVRNPKLQPCHNIVSSLGHTSKGAPWHC